MRACACMRAFQHKRVPHIYTVSLIYDSEYEYIGSVMCRGICMCVSCVCVRVRGTNVICPAVVVGAHAEVPDTICRGLSPLTFKSV